MKLLTRGMPVIPDHHQEDPYSILGLSTRVKAKKKIEARYKELCLTFHPDRLIRWNFSEREMFPFIKFFDLMNKAKETLVNKKMYKEFKDSGVFDPPTQQTLISAAKIELDKLFCKVCREVRDEQHNDFMEVMRRGVTGHLVKIEAELTTSRAEINRMRNIKKRTHSVMFKRVSQNIIEDLIEQIRIIEKQLLVYKEMATILKDCRYDIDEAPSFNVAFTFDASST